MNLEWQRFEKVFQAKPDYTFDTKQVDAINRHRKDLGGTLFFDRVCVSVGLKQGKTVVNSKFLHIFTSCSVEVLPSEVQ